MEVCLINGIPGKKKKKGGKSMIPLIILHKDMSYSHLLENR